LNNPATAPEDLLYVKLSDGIGSGVVLKGHLVGGGAGYAGELGHLKVASSGPLCTRCGGIGCLEVLAGAGAVRARIAAATGRRNANLTELLGHDHPAVGQAVHSAAWHVGTALSHAVTLINPSWVILDGDLAVHAEFRNTVEHALERQALPSSAKAVQIQTLDQLRASWGSSPLWNGREELSPVVLGALAHVVDELGDAYLDVRLSSL
jgi:predicted NBD/HSP70 family sugar kinase